MEKLPYPRWEAKFRPHTVRDSDENMGFARYCHDTPSTLPPCLKSGNLWTLHHGEGNSLWLANGLGVVDVLGYVVCERPWPPGADIIVPLRE